MKHLAPLAKFTGKVQREAPPPSRWGRSKTGTLFTWRKIGYRDNKGRKLYRLGYYMALGRPPLYSSGHLWTLEELARAGVEWLPEAPPIALGVVESAPDDSIEIPKGAVIDEDDEPDQLEAKATMIDEEVKAAEATIQKRGTTQTDPIAVTKALGGAAGVFFERYGIKPGDIAAHVGGKQYRVLSIIDQDTARVEQVLESGAKTPGRNMRGAQFRRPK